MKRNILVFICLFLIEQALSISPISTRNIIYLPMKKDHKYGDDICYYREFDDKLENAVYYVKPCEKGQYCEDQSNINQHLGFCRDIPTNVTNFPSYGDTCTTNGECQNGLICDGTCKLKCDSTLTAFRHNLNSFQCEISSYKKIENQYCKWSDPVYYDGTPRYYIRSTSYYGTFPGIPKECGIIHYTTITDYDYLHDLTPGAAQPTYKSFTRYIEQSREWCSIGEAKDGDFVDDWRFCKSGFTLEFYPNGDILSPSEGLDPDIYDSETIKMCATPTEIDDSNPLVGCVITYKGKDGSEHKYKAGSALCNDKNIVIESQLYSEFIEEFNNSNDEDKKNCYKIPQRNVGNCENVKLLKLYYFYNHIEDYLFYKDRKELEKVLHFKIQQLYPRYHELSAYLNLNYLFLLLILILI